MIRQQKLLEKKKGLPILRQRQKNKIKEAFPNVKLNFDLYPATGVKKYPEKGNTNKTK